MCAGYAQEEDALRKTEQLELILKFLTKAVDNLQHSVFRVKLPAVSLPIQEKYVAFAP